MSFSYGRFGNRPPLGDLVVIEIRLPHSPSPVGASLVGTLPFPLSSRMLEFIPRHTSHMSF